MLYQIHTFTFLFEKLELLSLSCSSKEDKINKVCFYDHITAVPTSTEEWSGDDNRMLFKLSEIRAATNDFSDTNKLGQGGFGKVYKVNNPILSEKINGSYWYLKYLYCSGEAGNWTTDCSKEARAVLS